MTTRDSISWLTAAIAALVIIILGMSPALARADERTHHVKPRHAPVLVERPRHRGDWEHGYHGYGVPGHVVRREVVYEIHRPLHREVVHARPSLSLVIPLPLFLH